MIWNTKLINEILENFEEDKSVKPILRDIHINHILSDDNEKIDFPFLIDPLINTLSIRSPHILFDYTKEEKRNISEMHHDATKIFKYARLKNMGVGYQGVNAFNDWLPYSFQLEWVNDYQKHKYNIFKTSRQIGSSQLGALCVLHYILSNHDKSVQFIGSTNLSCEDAAKRFYWLYEGLPFYMKVGVKEIRPKFFTGSKKKISIKFDNGSEILFNSAEKFNIGRSIDFLIMEDVKDTKILNNILPYLSTVGSFLIYGIPNDDKVFQQIISHSNIKSYRWEGRR